MATLHEIGLGIQQFGRIDNFQTGPTHPLSELSRVSRRAVQEDARLGGTEEPTGLNGTRLRLERMLEVSYIFMETFIREEYNWQPTSDNPRIIDLGGDIGGISVLYWKSKASNANVTVIEANPSTAIVEAESLQRKGLTDVRVINAAAAEESGETTLYLGNPGSGFHSADYIGDVTRRDRSHMRAVTIPTIKLSEVIGNDRVDLLKIDIEGSEGAVIRELAGANKLRLIDEIIMEFHNDPGNPTNSLAELLASLRNSGFTVERTQKSGQARRAARQQGVDVDSIRSSDKLSFILVAKRIPQ